MELSDFDYKLQEKLIAQSPLEKRDHSKLLKINPINEKIEEKKFYEIIEDLGENDVLVLNKTKVINARLNGKIKNKVGRRVEIFLHKQIDNNSWECLVFPGKKLKVGKKIAFYIDEKEALEGTIKETTLNGRIIEFDKGGSEFLKIIEQLGKTPLPPYIKQKLEREDRYQSIWGEVEGSVAAPTASLHFTEELIEKIKKKGVKIEKVLLHIGLGTFTPIITDNILDHKMHEEYIELEKEVADRINNYKKKGKRIIAVGTTSIRVLESFSDDNGKLSYGKTNTSIFIYPGYKWKIVDALITNFHLPKSTLLMLVSSFAGKDFIKKAYNYAIKNKFRFFSFGDSMFIEKRLRMNKK